MQAFTFADASRALRTMMNDLIFLKLWRCL